MNRTQLNELCRSSDLTMGRLAERLGISRTQLYRILSGEQGFSNPLQMLAFRVLVEGDRDLRERSQTHTTQETTT